MMLSPGIGWQQRAKLIRRGYQLARRLEGDLWVVHVKPPAVLLGASEQAAVDTLRALTEELGGNFIEVGADRASRSTFPCGRCATGALRQRLRMADRAAAAR